jgi:hypothetical protein
MWKFCRKVIFYVCVLAGYGITVPCYAQSYNWSDLTNEQKQEFAPLEQYWNQIPMYKRKALLKPHPEWGQPDPSQSAAINDRVGQAPQLPAESPLEQVIPKNRMKDVNGNPPFSDKQATATSPNRMDRQNSSGQNDSDSSYWSYKSGNDSYWNSQ